MKKKLLLSGAPPQYKAKDIMIFDDPERLRAVLAKLGWRILHLLSKKEMYPIEIAKKLKIHEQKVYYHIRKLLKAGLVTVAREEEKKGAVAKYYRASFPSLALALKGPWGSGLPTTIFPSNVPSSLSKGLRNLFVFSLMLGSETVLIVR